MSGYMAGGEQLPIPVEGKQVTITYRPNYDEKPQTLKGIMGASNDQFYTIKKGSESHIIPTYTVDKLVVSEPDKEA